MRTALILLLGTMTLAAQTPKVPGSSFVGIMVQEIDSGRAKALKLPEEAGVEVTRIEPDSPAEKAGLKVGDAVLQYNGQRVEGMEEFSRLVRETPTGREVKLEIYRNGAPQTIALHVGARHAAQSFDVQHLQDQLRQLQTNFPDLPRSFMTWRNSMLGIDAESLDGQLAQYFGVKEGVLVRSVAKDSAAEKAGMKAGDVVVRVDENHVATPSDMSMRLRSHHGGTAAIVVMRDHREMTLNVKLDDDDRARGYLGWRGRALIL
jgi:serine protease Do